MSDKPESATFVRAAISMIVGSATYSLSKAMISNNISEPEKKSQKATLAIGSTVVSMIVADKAANYVDAQITDWKRAFKKAWKKDQDKNDTQS